MTHDPLAFEFFNEIGIIDQLVSAQLTSVLPAGLTKAQFSVLNHFVRLGIAEQSPAELAAAFQVRRPTMTSTLTRLEQAGLVAIRADPSDGRGKLVSITPAGRDMREQCVAALARLIPVFETLISEHEIRSFLPALRNLRRGLDRLRD